MSAESRSEMFVRLMADADEREGRARERHAEILARSRAPDRVFIESLSDIDQSIKASTERVRMHNERLDEMGEWIRANTNALIAVLDRFDDLER